MYSIRRAMQNSFKFVLAKQPQAKATLRNNKILSNNILNKLI